MNRADLVAAYKRRPGLAVKKIHEHQLRALRAIDAGELDLAVSHWDRADDYNAVLDTLVRCRRCGRRLTDPNSVARRIGPECATKPAVAGCPICGGKGTMAVPDPVLGDFIDVDCFCQSRPRPDNAISGEVTDPAGATLEGSGGP